MQRDVAGEAEFSITIVFWLLIGSYGRSDLDNLAKPVIDTLFLPSHPQVKDPELTGALFSVDDHFVRKLTVEKQIASIAAGEGADITVEW